MNMLSHSHAGVEIRSSRVIAAAGPGLHPLAADLYAYLAKLPVVLQVPGCIAQAVERFELPRHSLVCRIEVLFLFGIDDDACGQVGERFELLAGDEVGSHTLFVAAGQYGSRDGIIVEVHNEPSEAICDGPQALATERFAEYAEQLRRIAEVAGREVSAV